MIFLPIVERELWAQSRWRRTYWMRFLVVLVASVVALGLLSPSFHGLVPPDQTGRILFLVLGANAFLHALLAGVFATADCISEEKRQGTLGLLFLTELQNADVVLGKLAARGLGPVYGLLAILPLLLLPALIGGVAAGEFWRAVVVLLNTIFLSLSVGLCISTCLWNGRTAMVTTLSLLGGLMLMPWLAVDWAVLNGNNPVPWTLYGSPLFSAVLVSDGLYLFRIRDFWASIMIQHLLGWAGIGWAVWWVRDSWLGREAVAVRTTRTPGVTSDAIARRAMLDQRPMAWLALRDRVSWSNVPLLGALGAGGLFGLALVVEPGSSARMQAGLAIAWVAHFLIKLWIVIDACRTLHEFRQSRLLEALLMTPLKAGEVVDGMARSIRHRVLSLVVVVLLVDMFTLIAGINLGLDFVLILGALAGIFVADAYTLAWVGLWQGMAAPTLTRALINAVVRVLFVPWILFLLMFGSLNLLMPEASSSPLLVMGVWFVASYLNDGVWSTVAILRLTSQFRLMAANDPPPGLFRGLFRRGRVTV